MSSILVLAIDDDPSLLTVLAHALTEYGIKVVPADRWSVAARELAEQDFDCILLDLNLQDSHGLETFWRLKANIRTRTPILVHSGHVDREIELQLAREDVRVIVKPSGSRELAEHIRTAIGEHEQQQEGRMRSKSPPGLVSSQIMDFVRDELRGAMDPVEVNVNRLIAWMNSELAAKRAEDDRAKRAWLPFLPRKTREKIVNAAILVVVVKLAGLNVNDAKRWIGLEPQSQPAPVTASGP